MKPAAAATNITTMNVDAAMTTSITTMNVDAVTTTNITTTTDIPMTPRCRPPCP